MTLILCAAVHIFFNEVIVVDIKESVVGSFGVLPDVAGEVPRIMMIGQKEIYIENYRALAEYNTDRIRLITHFGMVEICGNCFEIVQMKENNVIISGKILGVRFI